jgi:hypothetical protein
LSGAERNIAERNRKILAMEHKEKIKERRSMETKERVKREKNWGRKIWIWVRH